MAYWQLVAEEEERRKRRIALGLPPEMPVEPGVELTTFLQERLGPTAVPTGTWEKPPVPPTYGPNDPRSRNLATAKTIPPGLQKVADVLSPPGKPSRKVFSLLGALSTVDPERDVAAELQQASPIEKVMMALPVGAPVGSLAGTAGRGVLPQLGAGVARAIETGGGAAGIPRTAVTTAARVPKKPITKAAPVTPVTAAKPATQPVAPKTYDELQAAIDDMETALEKQGINPTRLIDPLEKDAHLLLGDGGWQPMPKPLVALYKERDAIATGELRQVANRMQPVLAELSPQTQQRVNRIISLQPDSSTGVSFAHERIPEIFTKPAQRRETLRRLAHAVLEDMADKRNVDMEAFTNEMGISGLSQQAREEALRSAAKKAEEIVSALEDAAVMRPALSSGTVAPVTEAVLPARGPMEANRPTPGEPIRTPSSAAGQVGPTSPAPGAAASEVPVGAQAAPVDNAAQSRLGESAPTGAGGKPPVPPTVTGAVPPSGPNIPLYVEPPMMGKNVLGMKPIQSGLTKTEEVANIARRTVGKVGVRMVEANPLVSGAFHERSRLKAVVDSQSGRLAAVNGTRLNKAFNLDKQGRITDLAGVDATLPGAPTIQDVAARLPRYWDKLSAEQQAAMLAVRRDTTPYRSLLDEVGVEVPARADVVEGGFYLPRGRADVEGADLPIKIGTGLGRGTKKGFEKPAVFDSQAAGIDAGYAYSPITDTLSAYARDAGTRAVDAHIATFFKTATDETGLLLGNTPKMRLLEQNPAIAKQHDALKASLERLKRLSAGLSKRQLEVIDKWSLDPTFDDLDVLLDGLKTMRAGRGQGMIAPEINAALAATRQAITAMSPAYKLDLRKAQLTPRLEGAVGLPGMQGWAFPDEIANAANVILRGEGQTTGLGASTIRVANAFNNLYRGVRATLDNSALGIQGLLGAADDPVAYAKAVGVNFKAWGPGGEAALGKYISQFDDAARAAGRLGSDDWARAGLRVGGAQTEFELGAGVSERIARLPVIRNANRAFGYFGDALRLDWADDMLAAEMRQGRTAQELFDSGDAQKIADIANNMTGWAQGKAFGSMGDLLLFAPRFLESRGETLVKGIAGLRPGASIGQRAARRSLLKMIGYGAVLTVAANEMLGNETDFRPIIKTKYGTGWNPNFMRVRFAGRDWSIYGTWDSLARAITLTAMGKPQEALRGLGSGVVSDAWDIIGDKDFNGKPVRATPEHFAVWLLTAHLPFGAEGAVASAKGGVETAQGGDVIKAAGGAVTMAGQLVGAKSSPVSFTDRANDILRKSPTWYGVPVGTTWDGLQVQKRAALAAAIAINQTTSAEYKRLDAITDKVAAQVDKEAPRQAVPKRFTRTAKQAEMAQQRYGESWDKLYPSQQVAINKLIGVSGQKVVPYTEVQQWRLRSGLPAGAP